MMVVIPYVCVCVCVSLFIGLFHRLTHHILQEALWFGEAQSISALGLMIAYIDLQTFVFKLNCWVYNFPFYMKIIVKFNSLD